ncbi:MAG: minor capsid protein [Ruminococcus flavefaciens]|nr:minor capsid protein [Ruminococcus flavefaciens]
MAVLIRQPANVRFPEISLDWNRRFGRKNTEYFDRVQVFVDNECQRLMAQYTPMKSSNLRKSLTFGTKVGSGIIRYNSPYARYQYYGKVMVSSVTGSAWARSGETKIVTGKELVYSKRANSQAQKRWFETMKTNHKEEILRGAAALKRR